MRIAIFGLGSIGTRHARNLIEMGESDLFGCDVRVGQSGFLVDVPIQAVSEASMVWEWKPEAVLICTPPATHYALVMEALQHGCAVFCEKPLAITVSMADEIVARNADKRPLAVGYQLRWQWSGIRRWSWDRDLVITHYQTMSTWPSQYEKDILEEFSHELDAAAYLQGPVSKLMAHTDGKWWQVELRHQHARTSIHIDTSAIKAFTRSIVDDSNDHLRLWKFDQAANDQAYEEELAVFLKICRGEDWDGRLCSAAEAAHVCRVIAACRQSARECKVVRL